MPPDDAGQDERPIRDPWEVIERGAPIDSTRLTHGSDILQMGLPLTGWNFHGIQVEGEYCSMIAYES